MMCAVPEPMLHVVPEESLYREQATTRKATVGNRKFAVVSESIDILAKNLAQRL